MTSKREKAVERAKRGARSRALRSDALVKVEQERRILAMWVAGESHEAIAEDVGLSVSTIYRVRRAALVRVTGERDEKAEELRELELTRLDELQAAHWPIATNPMLYAGGTHKSAGVVLSCIDRRAKMLGLDAPVRVDATVRSELDAQIEGLIESMEREGLVKLVG